MARAGTADSFPLVSYRACALIHVRAGHMRGLMPDGKAETKKKGAKIMVVKTDPGSYAIADEPFDDYSATYAPLHTPRGPVTLVFLEGGFVDVRSGYVTAAHSQGEVKMNVDVPGFTVDNITVGGSSSFRPDGAIWSPRDDAHLYGKGGTITKHRENNILAYWAEVVRRYTAEHPHIVAHAAHREALRHLADQEDAIRKAEETLAVMRKARTRMRAAVKRTLAEDIRTGADGAMDAPRPYYDEPVSGYVVELKNDPDFMRSLDAQRAAANGQEK